MTDETRGNETARKAEEMADSARTDVEEIKEQAGAQADAMLESGEEMADQRREQVASGLDRGATELDNRSEQLRELSGKVGDQLAQAGHKLAHGVESTAHYMQEHSTRDMTQTAKQYAKEHPVITGIGAISILLILRRLLK